MPTKTELAATRFLDATYALDTADVENTKWDAIYDEAFKAQQEYIKARAEQEEDDKHADRSEASRNDAEVDAAQEQLECNSNSNE
jgi:hypothetical protein